MKVRNVGAAVAAALVIGASVPAFAQSSMSGASPAPAMSGSMSGGSMGSMSHGSMGADPIVGGAPMSPSKTIVQNASQAKNLTTLVAAVKAGGLVETLSGPGPFTVFAPTNDAFAKLPAGTVDTLLKPENKKKLDAVLTYHVVPGKLEAEDLVEKIKAGKGKATLKTVEGENLVAKMNGDKVTITDAKGNVATVTQANVNQSNGVVHVIDSVLLP